VGLHASRVLFIALPETKDNIGPDVVRIGYEIGEDRSGPVGHLLFVSYWRMTQPGAVFGTSRRPACALAEKLLEDAHFLADKGMSGNRPTLLRRAISTAYHAAFHLFVEDFVEHGELEDQRARLGRMFNHGPMRNAAYAPQKQEESDSRSTGTARRH
jgi:hypothetical protein